jgi:hypothetical protein
MKDGLVVDGRCRKVISPGEGFSSPTNKSYSIATEVSSARIYSFPKFSMLTHYRERNLLLWKKIFNL